MSEPESLWSTMLASALSGALVRIPLHPIDTCKARLQVARTPISISQRSTQSANQTINQPTKQSLVGVFKQTYRTEGLRGLYAGFPMALVGSAPAACLYLTSYELNKRLLNKLSNNESSSHRIPDSVINFSAGLLAEFFSCILWVPIDVVKERMQVQGAMLPASQHYTSTFDAIRTIARHEGLRGVYRGYGATVASFGPYSAFYLSGYEACKQSIANALSINNVQELPFWAYLLCGGAAGGFAALITNPLDMAKLRLQVQRRAVADELAQSTTQSLIHSNQSTNPLNFGYRNLVHGMMEIARTEGTRALFKGAGARIAFFAPSSALNIAIFDTLKNTFNRSINKSRQQSNH